MSIFNIKISVSQKRSSKIHSISLSEGTRLISWGAVYMNFGDSHFFPASICIESEGTVVYIDPLMIEPTKTADYIFITHSHPDHFSIMDIKKSLMKIL